MIYYGSLFFSIHRSKRRRPSVSGRLIKNNRILTKDAREVRNVRDQIRLITCKRVLNYTVVNYYHFAFVHKKLIFWSTLDICLQDQLTRLT